MKSQMSSEKDESSEKFWWTLSTQDSNKSKGWMVHWNRVLAYRAGIYFFKQCNAMKIWKQENGVTWNVFLEDYSGSSANICCSVKLKLSMDSKHCNNPRGGDARLRGGRKRARETDVATYCVWGNGKEDGLNQAG